jgi:hypothetical protein
MCFPKAPKQDPAIKQQQQLQRQAELERLAEEKKKDVVAQKRTLRGSGVRSLLSGAGTGFGSNY